MAEDDWNKTHLKAMPIRPPFGPSEEDGRFMLDMTLPVLAASADPAVLVLGVTPRVVQLDWPAGTTITAIDSSPGMVASWSPHPTRASRVICAPWQEMPFEDASFDAVAGDGSFNSLPSLNAYGPAFRQIARVLRSNGALVLRFFLRPDRPEAPEVLVAQARTGAFPTTASFRLRFAMSLAGVDGSVELSALHRRFNALVSDRDELARATGWPRADIDRVDVDAGSKVRFTFPTLAALEALARPVFRIARMERGTYTQAEHCPTILFLRA